MRNKRETGNLYCLQTCLPLTLRLCVSFEGKASIPSHMTVPWIPYLHQYSYDLVYGPVIYISFFSGHSQICFVIWRYNSEWHVPDILMHAMAVALSEKTFTWTPWYLTIDTRLKRMDFTSRAFIRQFFSVLIHYPSVGISSQYAPTHALMHQCK